MILITLLLSFSAGAMDLPDVRRVREIAPGLYAGGNPVIASQGEGIKALAEAGVKTVIDLQGGDIDDTFVGRLAHHVLIGDRPDEIARERELCEENGIEFVGLPLRSHAPVDLENHQNIRRALDLMAQASPSNPIYVHCHHGADRTGLMVALYRVLHQGWGAKEAHEEWLRNGHGRASRLITGHLDVYFYRMIEDESTRACERRLL